MKLFISSINSIESLSGGYLASVINSDSLVNTNENFDHLPFDDITNYIWDEESRRKQEALLTPEQFKELQLCISCAKERVVNDLPLLEGEVFVSFEYNCLKDEFNGYPASTGVLKRETNLSTLWIIFDYCTWTGTKLIFKEEPKPLQNNEQTNSDLDNFAVSGLLIELGMAVIKGFAGRIGSSIFDKVFNSKPAYFDEMYNEIRNIVKQEIAQGKISELKGILDDVTRAISADYNVLRSRKNPVATKAELYAVAEKYYDRLNVGILGPLSQDNTRKPGFSVWMMGVYMLISITQELATIDPHASTPDESRFASTIQRNVNSFIDTAKKSMQLIEDKRRSYFSYGRYSEGHVAGRDVVVTYYYRWHDSYSGNYSDKFYYGEVSSKYDPEKDCKNKMNQEIGTVLEKMKKDMQYYEFLSKMETLKVSPIPKV